MSEWIDTIAQGVLLGGLYALFAAGLSLIFGVMRLVNLAHGDFIVLAAYLVLVMSTALGANVFVAGLLAAPVMFAIGYVVQRLLLNRTLGDSILPPLLVTFGLSIIVQNGLQEAFSADSRRLNAGAIETASFASGFGPTLGLVPLLTLVVAVVVIVALNQIFYRTKLGRAFRATSDDPSTAGLMGVDNGHTLALAMGLAMIVATIAAVFLGVRSNFDPTIGPARLIYAFEAVIIGGLGSFWGTLAGGIVLGIAQSIGGKINPEWQLLSGHLTFLAILVVRPRGLFPRAAD
jgi:branched-chain amino acid transport system permease protein